jgi:hypothetical protein
VPEILGNVTCDTGGVACAMDGDGNLADTIDLAAGASVNFTLSGKVASSATGTRSNTAQASVATDPTPGNNRATDNDQLTPQADVAVTKTNITGEAVPGAEVTYEIASPSITTADDITLVSEYERNTALLTRSADAGSSRRQRLRPSPCDHHASSLQRQRRTCHLQVGAAVGQREADRTGGRTSSPIGAPLYRFRWQRGECESTHRGCSRTGSARNGAHQSFPGQSRPG